ncbi:MAG: ArsR/SmtB family transcription factor [Phycisphaerales bacterium JB065]
MPRAPATSDVFNAVAEVRRREIIGVLAETGPLPVGDLVDAVGLPQPAVSKHLAVLREVGLVSVTKRGRQRVYELEASELRSVHEWVSGYERFWAHQTDRIKERAEKAAASRLTDAP